MLIVGRWQVGDDGITRPVVQAQVQGGDGKLHGEDFLVDSAADRSVFSADLLERLQFPAGVTDPGFTLQGVGGHSQFRVVNTLVEFTKDDGGPVRVRGEYAAFTDPTATDLSILGRDVLDLFDVIVSRRREEVLLLAGDHQYRVEPTT
jgi:hypothetical protein